MKKMFSEAMKSLLSFIHSQKKATDPTRFTNRGGNLLKEEKQRSDLHKNLPKVKDAEDDYFLKGEKTCWDS